MNALFLPGSNIESIAFARTLIAQIDLNINIETHEYSFWSTGERPNLKVELSLLPNSTYDVVFAKSAGCIVFLEAARQNRIQYCKAVLFGAPLNLLDQFSIEPFQETYTNNENTLFVHQECDYVCAPSILVQAGIGTAHIIKGNDHKYENTLDYIEEVTRHIS